MEATQNALVWGLEWAEGDTAPQALKFIIEVEFPQCTIAKCPIYKSEKSFVPSTVLKKALDDKGVSLPKGIEIVPVLEAEADNEYVIAVDDPKDISGMYYVLRHEGDEMGLYRVEQHIVRTADIVNILGLHKCCEDFIRVTTQKEKDLTKKPIEEIISELKIPMENLLSQLRVVEEYGQRYEEFVLDTCTDEFGLTCDQAFKVLALLRASIEKYAEESGTSSIADLTEVPYHG